MGTRIVPNGEPNESEVRWGVLVKTAAWAVGLFGSVCAVMLSAAVLRVFEMSSKLDVVEARQVIVLQQMALVNTKLDAEDYVTHAEMNQWLQSDARRAAINAMVGDGDIQRAVEREVNRLAEPRR